MSLMRTCAHCSSEIPDGARFCPSCGGLADDERTRVAPAPRSDVETYLPSGGSAATTPSAVRRPRSRPNAASYDAGDLIGLRYRIVGLLGKGGMGEVYRADDLKLGQPVALKFLPRELEGDDERLGRLIDEVRVARQVSHPNVCRVYDIDEADGRHVLTMEYIDGEDLATSLRRIGRFPPDKGLEITRQLCAGLAAVHDRGLLHRDLKPANVMLDGRGKVRLTDFGVAAEEAAVPETRGVAGTPAYMAPELLRGSQASVASDIYALGLVLYEVFAGRRAYEADTIADLKERQMTRPVRLSSSVSGLDPVIEEVIFRCLDPEPAARFPSAIAVAAALPGGDPLAAALEAGETPSPAMVAAAGEHLGLSRQFATGSLIAFFLLLAGVLTFVHFLGFTRFVPLDYPPDVLANKAQELLEQLGYRDRPVDTASGFSWNEDYIQNAAQRTRQGERWRAMRTGREAGVLFWYRSSPRYMIAQRFFGGGLSNGRVSESDPPPLRVGDIGVWLTSRGRLMHLEVVPPQVEEVSGPAPAVDWKPLFAAADLDMERFTPVEPTWAPLAWGDTRAAWVADIAGRSGTLRVEGAAWRGKPIFFRMVRPWTRPERQESRALTTTERVTQALGLTIILGIAIGTIALARRNLKLDRSDRTGAARLAWFIFALMVVGWALEADHVPSLTEVLLPVMGVSWALFTAGLAWLLYVALEPYVRSRWPHTIITWSRLSRGRLRDPLVGRDLLLGMLFGVVQSTLVWSGIAIARRFGSVEPIPLMPELAPLLASRFVVTSLISFLYSSITAALAFFILLFLLRLLLRKEWLAVVGFLAISAAAGTIGQDLPVVAALMSLAAAAVAVTALLRFGLVVYAVSNFVGAALTVGFPLAVESSRWYSAPSFFVVAGLAAAAVYGYHLASGGWREAPAARRG